MPRPLPDIELPTRLRELRKLKGESVYDLAPLVGKDASTITRYETGHLSMSIEIATAFALHFGVTLEDLLRLDRTEVAA